MDNLICVTYNVKGLGSPIKRKKVLNQLKKLNCAIAMLQETHLSDKEHMKLRREWVDRNIAPHIKAGERVVILFNKSVYFCHEKTFSDKEGRFLMVIGYVGGIKMTFVNVYAPNEDCPIFFKNIASLIADKAKGIILIGGDFNCVLRASIDRLPADFGPRTRKSLILRALMDELGLIDVWRRLHPKEKDFTFFSTCTQ